MTTPPETPSSIRETAIKAALEALDEAFNLLELQDAEYTPENRLQCMHAAIVAYDAYRPDPDDHFGAGADHGYEVGQAVMTDQIAQLRTELAALKAKLEKVRERVQRNKDPVFNREMPREILAILDAPAKEG